MKNLFLLAAWYIVCAGNRAPLKQQNNLVQQPPMQFLKQSADTTTLNGQWFLQPVLPADTALGKTPVLNINVSESNFSGNTGCNNMRGSFQKTDTSLVFNKNIVTTKMMCTGYNEAAFIRSLLRTNRYKLENGELVLLFDATELSRWTRKKAVKKILST